MAVKAIAKRTVDAMKPDSRDQFVGDDALPGFGRLDREPLLVRVDRLFAVCKPAVGFAPIRGYSYERDRVERLDNLRQTIVHRPERARAPIPDCDSEIRFLFQTGLFLWTMLNAKYDVKIDALFELRRSKAIDYAFHAMR